MKKKILEKSVLALMVLEFVLIIILFSFFPSNVFAGVAEHNVTVQTLLNVGAVYPEVINVSLQEDAASVSLIPATTKDIYCAGVVIDYNGQQEINNITAFSSGYRGSRCNLSCYPPRILLGIHYIKIGITSGISCQS